MKRAPSALRSALKGVLFWRRAGSRVVVRALQRRAVARRRTAFSESHRGTLLEGVRFGKDERDAHEWTDFEKGDGDSQEEEDP